MTDKMKTNVNSTFSSLSNTNSTLDLYNNVTIAVPTDVFNATISAQLTSLETTFQTNDTTKEPVWMSTTENSTTNEKFIKPVTLFQTKTSEILTKQVQTLKPIMKISPETTSSPISSKNVTEKEIKSKSIFSTTLKTIFDKEIITSQKSSSEIPIPTKSISTETSLKMKCCTTYSRSSSGKIHTLSKTDTSKPTMTSQKKTQPYTITTESSTGKENAVIQINAKTTEKVIEKPHKSTTENINKKQKKQVTEKINTRTTDKVIEKPHKSTTENINEKQKKQVTEKINTRTTDKVIEKFRRSTTENIKKKRKQVTEKINIRTTEKLKKIKDKKITETIMKKETEKKNQIPTTMKFGTSRLIKNSKTTLKWVLHGKYKPNIPANMSTVAYKGVKMSTTSNILKSQSSMSDLHLETTTEPAHTMGAGPLVIVVLLPFLALFLIAVVTALRRKMKKSHRRIIRIQSRDMDNLLERNQSQMIPLTKPEINE